MTPKECGHTAHGNFGALVCVKPLGHTGLHEQRTQLRDRTERTNWGSDGLAPWATKDKP